MASGGPDLSGSSISFAVCLAVWHDGGHKVGRQLLRGVGDFTYFHFVIFFFSFLARFSGVCSKGRNARNLALSLYYLNNINAHLLNALEIKLNWLR